jgi:UTP--glucose-1-phosphate uridylyltransferase
MQESSKVVHLLTCLHFVEQNEPLGYGHAVHSARGFVDGAPFLLLLGDHLYISRHPKLSCAQQLVNAAISEKASVSSVNPVREHLIRHYGTLTGERLTSQSGLYKIKKIIEKPSISAAEVELPTPGLRAGYYLCFFGMHVFTPTVFEILAENFKDESMPDRYGLTPALNSLANHEPYLALELKGTRYDVSAKYGMLRAQIALGLAGKSRDQILSAITDMLAEDSVHRSQAD